MCQYLSPLVVDEIAKSDHVLNSCTVAMAGVVHHMSSSQSRDKNSNLKCADDNAVS